MRGWREPAAAVAVAGLVLGGASGTSALASNVAGEERAFRLDALGHAEAVGAAYRRLEEHVLLDSTAITSWGGSRPPASTGWLPAWSDRGVRARYCDDVLLVYLDYPAGEDRLKGVGEDHRSVHVAPHAFVGEGNDGRFPTLHWLEGNVAQGGRARPDVPLPSCMIGVPLPSGRAALAGGVEDPWRVVNQRDGVTYEFMAPDPQACPAGQHGGGIRTFREIMETLNARGDSLIPRVVVEGAWQEFANACRTDYEVWEYSTQECTWNEGAPHNREMVGEVVYRRLKRVTAGGVTYGAAEELSSSCWTQVAGQTVTPIIDEVRDPQSRTVKCGKGYTGTRRYSRTVITRSTKFPWDASPVVTVRGLSWRLASSSCKEEPVVTPRKCDPVKEKCDGDKDCDPLTDPQQCIQGEGDDPVEYKRGRRVLDVDETRRRDCSLIDSRVSGTYQETRTVRYEFEVYENGTLSTPVVIGTGVWWMSQDNCVPPSDFEPPGPPGTPGSGVCGPPGDGSASPGEGQCDGMDASIAAAVAAQGSGSGGGGAGGGCYLTTAVVEHRGVEADDGPTLTALRQFRDTYMMETPVRRALVRLYYRLAPAISRDLKSSSPAWDEIGRHIDAAVEALEAGERGKAFRAYWAASMRAFSLWAAFKIKRVAA